MFHQMEYNGAQRIQNGEAWPKYIIFHCRGHVVFIIRRHLDFDYGISLVVKYSKQNSIYCWSTLRTNELTIVIQISDLIMK